MTKRLDFDFDSYDDFDSFLDKHEDVINAMGRDDVNEEDLTDQMRMSVKANEQLPEYFEFTPQQLKMMYQRDPRGMKKLMDDGRVTTHELNEGSD